ncbi:MAG: hypothetical protein HRU16_11420, partial [Planctomycetes bacterium]|nr:hypothetical protein [Planctomycetota bacterium]
MILLLDGAFGISGLAAASVTSTLCSWVVLEIGLRRYLALPKPRSTAVLTNLAVTSAVACWALLVTFVIRQLIDNGWIADLVLVVASAPAGLGIAILVGRAVRSGEVQSLQKLLTSAFRLRRQP